MKNFNLLATTNTISESDAASELWIHLRELGDEIPKVNRTSIKGIIKGQTSIELPLAIHKLRDSLRMNPDRFKSIFRVLPIECVVETKVCLIVETVKSLAEKMGTGESFRITLEKRKTDLRSLDVIKSVAKVIPKKVNLEKPDWIVLIEILGKETAVSVVRPSDILNIQKEKYKLSSERKKCASLNHKTF
jgi:tRNA acetyltransferase TAN1